MVDRAKKKYKVQNILIKNNKLGLTFPYILKLQGKASRHSNASRRDTPALKQDP